MAYDDDEEESRKRFERIWGGAFAREEHAKHIAAEAKDKKFESAHPDCHRAEGGWACDASGRDIRFALLVRNEAKRMGAIVLRASGDPHTGKLTFHGMSLFTKEELEFDDASR